MRAQDSGPHRALRAFSSNINIGSIVNVTGQEAGAGSASLLWFALLGFGARWLAPWFGRPRAWQLLDGLIGVTMFVLSALLVRHALLGL